MECIRSLLLLLDSVVVCAMMQIYLRDVCDRPFMFKGLKFWPPLKRLTDVSSIQQRLNGGTGSPLDGVCAVSRCPVVRMV